MSTPQVQLDLAPNLEKCFFFDAAEASYDLTGITGCIPEWLRGSYYINGPARFQRDGFRYRHWLDGDGMVCTLRFSDQGVHFCNRFVGTRKLRDEEAAGRPIYRTFGTQFPGDRLRNGIMLEPPANITVYAYAGTLLAFGEQTLPIELDPATLETSGSYDFRNSLNEFSPFAAHAKFDPESGHILNFGISYSANAPALYLYEFDRSAHLLRRRRHFLQNAHSIHDFGISETHAAFFVSPLILDFDHFLREESSVLEALRWRPEIGSQIIVMPRQGGEPFSVSAGQGYCLHVINSFVEAGRLILDVIELEHPIYREYLIGEIFATAPAGQPVRYLIELSSRSLLDHQSLAYNRSPDFPSVDARAISRPYSDFWMLGISSSGTPGRKFFDQIVRCSWRDEAPAETYQLLRGEYFGGEPVVIANPVDAAEAILILQHLRPHADAVDFVLFDAFSLSSGPMARLPLKFPIHPGFHSSFQFG